MTSQIHNFDVLVVGGGPAGLSAAAVAAKDGLKVAVIEKDPSIANTIRTSGITWWSDVEELGLPHSFCHPISRYGIHTRDKESVKETSKAEACALDIRKLYQYLAQQAATLGTEIFLGAKALSASFGRHKEFLKISALSSEGPLDFAASLVVDASGFSSTVGTSLGLIKKWERFGTGAEYETYAEKVDKETWALMVGRQYSPAGYAWMFPVAENRVRIGVGIGRPESNENPYTQLKFLIEKRPGPLKRLGRICPLEFHSGVVPNQGPRSFTMTDRLIMVGDSAGHLNPLLLEGIRFAIKFGRLAGRVAKRAVDQADTKVQLKEYEMKWKKEVWSDFQIGLAVQKKWLKMSDEQWDQEATILDFLSAEDILEIFKCKFSSRKLMKLVSTYPELMKTNAFPTILGAKIRKIFA